MNYNEVKDEVIKFNDLIDLSLLVNQVHWIHTDGSSGCWNNATVTEYDYGNWFVIYTEHHGYFIHHKDNLIQLEEVNVYDRTVTNLIELPDYNVDDEDDNEVMYTNEDYLTWLKESEGYKGTILE